MLSDYKRLKGSLMKKIVYIDMDGVLVDFQSGLDKLDPEIEKEHYQGQVQGRGRCPLLIRPRRIRIIPFRQGRTGPAEIFRPCSDSLLFTLCHIGY